MTDRILGARPHGSMFTPGEGTKHFLDTIRVAKGFGRWVYCKYCYKNVRPALGGINQIVCYRCGSGLSPDFFRRDNLERYWPLWEEYTTVWAPDHKSKKEKKLRAQMAAIVRADERSEEAREWLRQMKVKDAIGRLDKP